MKQCMLISGQQTHCCPERHASTEQTLLRIERSGESAGAVRFWDNDDLHQLIECDGDLLQDGDQFRLKGRETVQTTAVMAAGFDERELVKTLNQTAGRHLQTLLADLTLEQVVGKQGSNSK